MGASADAPEAAQRQRDSRASPGRNETLGRRRLVRSIRKASRSPSGRPRGSGVAISDRLGVGGAGHRSSQKAVVPGSAVHRGRLERCWSPGTGRGYVPYSSGLLSQALPAAKSEKLPVSKTGDSSRRPATAIAGRLDRFPDDDRPDARRGAQAVGIDEPAFEHVLGRSRTCRRWRDIPPIFQGHGSFPTE